MVLLSSYYRWGKRRLLKSLATGLRFLLKRWQNKEQHEHSLTPVTSWHSQFTVQHEGWSFSVAHVKDSHLLFHVFSSITRRRQRHPTRALLPGKSHGRRSLVGWSPWGREELDMTERLHIHFSLSCTGEGNGTSLVAQMVKRLPTMRETQVQSLGQEDLLEKEMATHSSTRAWKIPGTQEPGRLQSMGLQIIKHVWEGNGNPIQCSCLENPRDGGAWWAAVYGVAQSRTRLKWLSGSSSIHNHMSPGNWIPGEVVRGAELFPKDEAPNLLPAMALQIFTKFKPGLLIPVFISSWFSWPKRSLKT